MYYSQIFRYEAHKRYPEKCYSQDAEEGCKKYIHWICSLDFVKDWEYIQALHWLPIAQSSRDLDLLLNALLP